MQRLEVSGAVRSLYGSLGVKGLKNPQIHKQRQITLHSDYVTEYPLAPPASSGYNPNSNDRTVFEMKTQSPSCEISISVYSNKCLKQFLASCVAKQAIRRAWQATSQPTQSRGKPNIVLSGATKKKQLY